MRTARLYTEQPLRPDGEVLLEQAASHHLLRVLRVQPGATVVLFNGDGREYQCAFAHAQGRQACLKVIAVQEPVRESALQIRLGQGVSRGERMDLVMQKSVELGVQSITPLWTQRSQVQLDGKRLEKRLAHWQGIIRAACEQSGRVRLPELHPANRLGTWLAEGRADETRLVLDPQAEHTLADIRAGAKICVLIGPEGGLERSEIDQAGEAGFSAVRLGPRVLRTETAALATLAALQMLWGDFRA